MKKYRIEGVIGWESTANKLSEFLQDSAGDDIELTISSPGGLVGEALDMFNQIRNYPGNVVAVLSGYSMSAASYIPMAANEVIAEDNAIMMIHNAQGIAFGDHNTMYKTGNIMRGMSAMLGNAYAKFTGKTKEEVAEMMDGETWLFGEEIVDAGFAHALKVVTEGEDSEVIEAQARLAFSAMVAKMSTTEASMLYEDVSRAAVALGSMGVEPPKNQEEVINMLTLEKLKSDYPELVEAISKEATAGIEEKLEKARQEGIEAENARIQDVLDQSIAGADELINSLAFDKKTTGPEAAVKVIQLQKEQANKTMQNFIDDAPEAVDEPANDAPDNLTAEEKAKKEWDKDAQLRADFNEDFSKYTNYLSEDKGIKFKTLKNRGE